MMGTETQAERDAAHDDLLAACKAFMVADPYKWDEGWQPSTSGNAIKRSIADELNPAKSLAHAAIAKATKKEG